MLELLSIGPRGWGDELLLGMAMTLVIAIAGFLIGLVFGTATALARTSGQFILVLLARSYVTVIRGIPELLIIYILFIAGGPYLAMVADAIFMRPAAAIDALLAGILSIAIISGAYSSEIIRGAVQTILKGQFEASAALGLTRWQAFRLVIWPQLLRHAVPPLGSEWLLTIKGTALVSVTGLVELMRATSVAAGSTRSPFTFYAVGFALYLVLALISEIAIKRLERRLDAPYRDRV